MLLLQHNAKLQPSNCNRNDGVHQASTLQKHASFSCKKKKTRTLCNKKRRKLRKNKSIFQLCNFTKMNISTPTLRNHLCINCRKNKRAYCKNKRAIHPVLLDQNKSNLQSYFLIYH